MKRLLRRKLKNVLLLFSSILLLLSSCKETQYIQLPVKEVDTVYITKTSTDTLMTKDSVIIKQINDTVLIEKVKYVYKNSLVRDTVIQLEYKEKPVEVIKTVEVPKQLSILDKILINIGAIAIALSVLWIAIKIKRACS